MSRILVNYDYNRMRDSYTILNSGMVYADLPVAIVKTEDFINEPILIIENGESVLVDKATYLLTHKCFKVAVNEKGELIESQFGNNFFTSLDVNFEDLELKNGQIVVKEKEKKTKEKPKGE